MPAQSIWTLLSWGPDGWSDDIAYGVIVTVLLALATLPIGLTIGFFIALGKQSEEPSLRLAANIYRASRRIQELLQDLLNVSRGSARGAELCKLREVAAAGCESLLASAEQQHVEQIGRASCRERV